MRNTERLRGMREPSVSTGYAKGLVDLAVAKGADRRQLLAAAGLEDARLDELNARTPFATYVKLMRAAKQLSGDRALGLHYGEANLGQVSIVGLIGHASTTMADAFAQLNHFVRLVVDVGDEPNARRFQIVRDRRGTWMVDTRPRPNDFPELTESAFAQLACSTRPFGDAPKELEVHVTHPDPGYREEYERVFKVPVVFGAKWNALRVDEAWGGREVKALPAYVGEMLNERARGLLKSLDEPASLRDRVEATVTPWLATREATVQRVAAQLGLSRQTLYRQLKAEGATFERVLDDVRRRQALRMLGEEGLAATETSYRLGFSDPAAFSRAFKRWTGLSPRAFQADLPATTL